MRKLLFVLGLAVAMVACKSDKKEKDAEEESYVIPASEKSSSKTPLTASVERGKKIYGELCVTCLLPTGKGMTFSYPPREGSNWLTEKR